MNSTSTDRSGAQADRAPSRRRAVRFLAALVVISAVRASLLQAPCEAQGLPPLERDRLGHVVERTVIARLFQQTRRMLGADRDAAYVAAQLRSVNPRYVSGLMRLGKLAAGSPLAQDEELMAALNEYREIRAALPGTRFDFVLNICQFDKADRLIDQMTRLNEALGPQRPDIWFFDFFDRPYHPSTKRPCNARPQVVERAISWIHEQGQLAGGNVWSGDFSRQADLVAVPDERGVDATLRVVRDVRRRRPGVPCLVHIENNPQKMSDPNCPKCANGGKTFISASNPQREAYLRPFAQQQGKLRYSFMYPVFFPLTPPGEGQRAFDAKAKGFLDEIRRLMKLYN